MEKLLKEAVVCERLQVGRTTLWSLNRDGELVPVKIGKSTRWAEADLDAYVERLRSRRVDDMGARSVEATAASTGSTLAQHQEALR